MQKAASATNRSDGFLLLDSAMNPILINSAAAQILSYPQKSEAQNNLTGYMVSKIRATLLSEEPSNGSVLVSAFKSGRRRYLCRTFHVDAKADGNSQAAFAAVLERAPVRTTSLAQLSERFHLTLREQEVAQFLLHGLTSKETGMRMQISPNTVKAFLRLIMVKMGVSTRSAIVGKALITEPVTADNPGLW
jgi:DNA-binding CsgD family transcriptional regulator